MSKLFQSSFKPTNTIVALESVSANLLLVKHLASLLSISLQLDGTTDTGVEVKNVPNPFKFPQEALKKYLLPCVNSIVQKGLDMSSISHSPVTGVKSALVDH